jgi:hypothetical protein
VAAEFRYHMSSLYVPCGRFWASPR